MAGFGHVQKANGMRLAFGYGYNPEQFAFLWNERAFGWHVAIAIYKIIPAGFLWYGFIAMPEILADHFVIGALVIAFKEPVDRKRVVEGKSVSVIVDPGGGQ